MFFPWGGGERGGGGEGRGREGGLRYIDQSVTECRWARRTVFCAGALRLGGEGWGGMCVKIRNGERFERGGGGGRRGGRGGGKEGDGEI